MKRGRINIETYEDLLDIMTDMFDEFLFDFDEIEGLTRPIDEDDEVDPSEVSFLYTYRGQGLADRYKERLQKIFHKHFPHDDFELSSIYYREF